MSAPTDRFDLDEAFDEAWYIRNYADIGAAVVSGKHKSGWQHYAEHGRAEGRQPYDPRLVALIEQANEQLQGRLFVADEFLTTPHGALLLGWIDDRSDPLVRLELQPYFGPAHDLLPRLARFRRDDIAVMLNVSRDAHDYGFWVALDGLAPRIAAGRRAARDRLRERPRDGTAYRHAARRRGGAARSAARARAAAAQRTAGAGRGGTPGGPLARALTRTLLARSATAPPTRFGHDEAAPTLSVIIPLMADAGGLPVAGAVPRGRGDPWRAPNSFTSMAARGPRRISSRRSRRSTISTASRQRRCAASARPARSARRNAGAAAARGATLLFLAPDAMPAPGWLDRALPHAEKAAITGACLLDEDEAVIGCGLAWRLADRRTGFWDAEPRLAGMPAAHAPAGPEAVDAVPARPCWCRSRVFAALGGFGEDFLGPDWDDLDLCLRAQRERHPGRRRSGAPRAPAAAPGASHRSEREQGAALLDAARFNELWAGTLAGRP